MHKGQDDSQMGCERQGDLQMTARGGGKSGRGWNGPCLMRDVRVNLPLKSVTGSTQPQADRPIIKGTLSMEERYS